MDETNTVRNYDFTVGVDSITPAELQAVGVQGEHNVTNMTFSFSAEVLEALGAWIDTLHETLYFRFDGETSTGHIIHTTSAVFPYNAEHPEKTKIVLPLDRSFTRDGGTVKITLVITSVEGNSTDGELYSWPCHIGLISKDNSIDGKLSESITALEQSAKNAARRAEDAAAEAVPAAERTVRAQRQLEHGDYFIFDGNGVVIPELFIDTEFDAKSTNPATSKAIAGYVTEQIAELPEVEPDMEEGDDGNPATKGAIKDYVGTKIDEAISGTSMLELTYPVGSLIEEYESDIPAGGTAQGIIAVLEDSGDYSGYYKLYIGEQQLPGHWEKIVARFTIGSGTSTDTGTVFNAGDTGGHETQTLTMNNIPSHAHKQNMDGGNSTLYPAVSDEGAGIQETGAYTLASAVGTISTAKRILTEAAGKSSPDAVNILPPYIVFNKWHRIRDIVSQNTEE